MVPVKAEEVLTESLQTGIITLEQKIHKLAKSKTGGRMSQAKVHLSKSKKPRVCEECGSFIPVGSDYLWWEFISGVRRVRCLNSACKPVGEDLSIADYWKRVSGHMEDISELGAINPKLGMFHFVDEMMCISKKIEKVGRDQTKKLNRMPDSFKKARTWRLLRERADICFVAARVIKRFPDGLRARINEMADCNYLDKKRKLSLAVVDAIRSSCLEVGE